MSGWDTDCSSVGDETRQPYITRGRSMQESFLFHHSRDSQFTSHVGASAAITLQPAKISKISAMILTIHSSRLCFLDTITNSH